MTRTSTSDSLWILPGEALRDLLMSLAARCELWVPVAVGEGARFLPYREDLSPELVQTPPAHPAKSILFPQSEVVFTYQREDAGIPSLTVPEPDSRPLVAFGVRSCDRRAVTALDAVFLNRSVPDSLYRQRRQRLRVVGLACPSPSATCFCDRMGGGPFDAAGTDIQIIPLEEGYAFRILTQEGRQLLSPSADLFRPAGEEIARQVATLEEKTSLQTGPPVDFEALSRAVKSRRDDPYWEALADACLGCGICTFVCPVCSCFTLVDEGTPRAGRRLRAWDACMFPTFTKEASGHNPRGAEVARVKQRFFHKFTYCIENEEPPGCVGCGRCVAQCPTAIDIREIVRHFQEDEPA